ncbi:DUF3987 domain-containing protein [Palleronia sediminis]|uniref:DUF3987 domain-containing protein n=1 Tax=Palleronia sediminis TaxID=2547833 RepID=UPI003F82305D
MRGRRDGTWHGGGPVAIPAASTRSVASPAVQFFADLETSGALHPPSLYAQTIARSGERKSSCDGPLKRYRSKGQ